MSNQVYTILTAAVQEDGDADDWVVFSEPILPEHAYALFAIAKEAILHLQIMGPDGYAFLNELRETIEEDPPYGQS